MTNYSIIDKSIARWRFVRFTIAKIQNTNCNLKKYWKWWRKVFYSGCFETVILNRYWSNSEVILVKLEGQSKATFAALFGLRAGGGVDLSAAYRYNQNMMEYYTCEYKLYLDEH